MAYVALKIVGLGSSAAAIGGGLAAGSSAFSGNTESQVKPEKVKHQDIPNDPVLSFEENKEPTLPPQKSCVVYEMEEPTPKGSTNNRKFTKIKQKFGGKGAFLEALQQKGTLWNNDELKSKSETRCNEGKDTYIWWGNTNNGNTWIYASDMNEKGVDWTKDPDVIKNSRDILKLQS
ncbi:hypothetical protein MHF_1120 [Mycoplasma haemofelis Ohio2]|uniref:Uncharacterized protein n=1 Tax=Mycoplasma haemofelis (strain Ohio2) TaxID=859194 RepID=F6FJK8_MYCHI|nr:hypothetical protein MHF_1120 [Mycoplasma haemofelis Ohio2]